MTWNHGKRSNTKSICILFKDSVTYSRDFTFSECHRWKTEGAETNPLKRCFTVCSCSPDFITGDEIEVDKVGDKCGMCKCEKLTEKGVPKCHVERFPGHAAFTAVPFFFISFAPSPSPYWEKNIYICVCVCVCGVCVCVFFIFFLIY